MSKIEIDENEYNEIIEELDRLSTKEELEGHDWMLLSASFWDNFLTKIISNFVSVKVWILVFILYIPYQLLVSKIITADHYTKVLIIVAPVVVGLREYSKAKVNNNNGDSSLIDKAKRLFKI